MKHFLKSVVVATFIGFIGIQPICAQTGEEADLTSLLNEGRYPVTFANDATHPWTIFDDRIATIGNMENRDKVSSLSFRIDSMSVPTGGGEADLSSLLNEGSYPVTFTNDTTYPWTIYDDGIAKSGNVGNRNTVSSLSFSYESNCQTEVGLSWRNNYGWCTFINLYVDGVSMGSPSSEWTRKRFFLPKGKHVVEIRDSITDTYEGCFGQV